MNGSLVRVSVSGTSMFPTLLPFDSVIIARSDSYKPGAILVFTYKSEGYIIHRLLGISNNQYFCKGDNSFRLEEVNKENVLGKVLFVKRGEQIFKPPEVDNEFIEMSMNIYKEFVRVGYNVGKTKESTLYVQYRKIYLMCNEDPMPKTKIE